jgi:hypothetical protein
MACYRDSFTFTLQALSRLSFCLYTKMFSEMSWKSKVFHVLVLSDFIVVIRLSGIKRKNKQESSNERVVPASL